MASLVSKPTLIETENLKFLVMDAPKESNLHLYIKEMKKHNVLHIVRISEPSYSVEEVQKAGISLHVRIHTFAHSFIFAFILYFLFCSLYSTNFNCCFIYLCHITHLLVTLFSYDAMHICI